MYGPCSETVHFPFHGAADGTLRPVAGVPAPVVGGQGDLLEVLTAPEADKIRIAISLAARRPDETVATAAVARRLEETDLRDVRTLAHAAPGAEERGVHFAGRLASDGEDRIFVALGDRGVREWSQVPGATAGRVLHLGWDGSPRGAGVPGWDPAA